MALTNTGEESHTLLDGRYRVLAQLGNGGSARVYLADDVRLRRRVAVKVLHPALVDQPGFRERFESEARASAAFSHPHVVAVYDWGETERGPFLVTEFLGGGSLHAIIATGRTLSPAQALKVGLEASSGLNAAHRRDMVHRDIKPANLLFDEGGRLRVADFGLVKALGTGDLTEPDTAVLGTVRYAAPERGRPGPADGRSDVYSLALSMVEALTGTVAGPVDDPVELLAYRARHDVAIPEDFGAARGVLELAGAANIDDRPTADEFMRGLVDATEGFGPPGTLPLVGARRTPIGEVDPDATVPVGTAPATELLTADDGRSDDTRSSAPPLSPRRHWWILAVLLVLGGAIAAASYLVSSTEPPVVPLTELGNLTSESIDDVRTLAFQNNWLLDEVQVRDDEFERNTVIRQSPAPGSQLASGAALVVDVVTGPRLTMVPWVVGLDQAAAEERLESRRFVVGTREPRFDETVEAGVVMFATVDGAEVTAGSLLEPGSAFELVVSEGPIPREVPMLEGRTVEEAQNVMEQLRLELVRDEDVFSETVEVGVVVSQSIAPRIQVERGTAVTIVVSKGPDIRIVPDVSGMSIDEATRALERVGLVRSGVSGGGDVVDSSSPGAGTELREGDTVELWAPV